MASSGVLCTRMRFEGMRFIWWGLGHVRLQTHILYVRYFYMCIYMCVNYSYFPGLSGGQPAGDGGHCAQYGTSESLLLVACGGERSITAGHTRCIFGT